MEGMNQYLFCARYDGSVLRRIINEQVGVYFFGPVIRFTLLYAHAVPKCDKCVTY